MRESESRKGKIRLIRDLKALNPLPENKKRTEEIQETNQHDALFQKQTILPGSRCLKAAHELRKSGNRVCDSETEHKQVCNTP